MIRVIGCYGEISTFDGSDPDRNWASAVRLWESNHQHWINETSAKVKNPDCKRPVIQRATWQDETPVANIGGQWMTQAQYDGVPRGWEAEAVGLVDVLGLPRPPSPYHSGPDEAAQMKAYLDAWAEKLLQDAAHHGQRLRHAGGTVAGQDLSLFGHRGVADPLAPKGVVITLEEALKAQGERMEWLAPMIAKGIAVARGVDTGGDPAPQTAADPEGPLAGADPYKAPEGAKLLASILAERRAKGRKRKGPKP